MNTQELAKAFTDMCTKGELEAAGKKFWSDDIVSREQMTGDMAVLKGRKAVEGKSQWWNANHEVHNFKVEGPMCTAINSSFASRQRSRQRARNARTSMRSGYTRSGTVRSSRKASLWAARNPNRIASFMIWISRNGAACPLWVACSTGHCNTACSLSAGVSNPKVLRGR